MKGQITNSLFDFWKEIGAKSAQHPRDRKIFKRVKHRFKLNCFPTQFTGRLRYAPVVLLFLSPGYSRHESSDFRKPKRAARHAKMRTGRELVWAKNEHASFWKWFRRITKVFDIKNDHDLRKYFAILNIGAYHSPSFHDTALLAALPSSRASLEWAQECLFPEAIKKRRVVICLRAAAFWGLKPGTSIGWLYAPRTNRGGFIRLKRGKAMRERIKRDVKFAIARAKRESLKR